MEFTQGYVVDLNMVENVCEWLQGRLADIILDRRSLDYPPKVIAAIRSEMNVYLAYLGHLRFDRWSPLPLAHAFTIELKKALEDGDVERLVKLADFRPLPSRAGRVSELSEAVFPKWWLQDEVSSPDWSAFDLGGHICAYHARLLEEGASASAAARTSGSLATVQPDSGPDFGPRTAAEFEEEMRRIRQQLMTAHTQMAEVLQGLQEIWQGDYKQYTETNENWQNIGSPKMCNSEL